MFLLFSEPLNDRLKVASNLKGLFIFFLQHLTLNKVINISLGQLLRMDIKFLVKLICLVCEFSQPF